MRNTKPRGGRRRVQLLRNWTGLPEDATASILSRLRPIDVFRAQRVCAPWRRICNRLTPDRIDLGNDLCEKSKSTHRRCLRYWTNPGVESVVRQVVVRSAGDLVDINLNSQCPRVVVTENLLKYIVQSSKRIKRLVLECRNDGITAAGLSSVAPELGMLEDLEIHLQSKASYEKPMLLETLEMVGRSCPLLRSFQLFAEYGQLCPAVWRGGGAGSTRNDVAHAIARTMHGLQHLTLKGNEMDEKGLEELLDSCPRLDSVDATDCFDLEFREDLVGRCTHFKGFRQPDAYSDDEYSSDYEVDV